MPTHTTEHHGHGKGGRPVFSEQEELAIAERIALGEKQAEIAEEKHVHRNTISNIWKRRRGELTVSARKAA